MVVCVYLLHMHALCCLLGVVLVAMGGGGSGDDDHGRNGTPMTGREMRWNPLKP